MNKVILIVFLSVGATSAFANTSIARIMGDSMSLYGLEFGKGELSLPFTSPLPLYYSEIIGGKSISSISWLEFELLYGTLLGRINTGDHGLRVKGITGIKAVTPTHGVRIGVEPWFGGTIRIPIDGRHSACFIGELQTFIGIGDPERLTISCVIPISAPSIKLYSLWYHHFMGKTHLSIGLSYSEGEDYRIYSLGIRKLTHF
jgi:hypothetical protein